MSKGIFYKQNIEASDFTFCCKEKYTQIQNMLFVVWTDQELRHICILKLVHTISSKVFLHTP